MNNLDLMIEKIIGDAAAQSDVILDDAKKRAEDIIYQAKIDFEERKDNLIAKARRQAEEKISKAVSSSQLAQRNAVMSAKLEILDSTFSQVIQNLNNLEKEEYMGFLLKYLESSLEDSDGTVIMNKKDKETLGKEFAEKADIIAKQKDKGSLSLSENTASISGGFILKYGDIEINCSTDAIVSLFREKNEKKIYDEIFA